MRKLIPLFLILCLLLAGCNFPLRYSMTNQTPLPLGYNSGGPTPTPFQPMSSDGQQTPAGTDTEGTPSPTPTPYADLGFELPKSMVNILLLGSDRRADNSFRTDVIMLLSLDPEKGTAALVSFPRDMYVTFPGIGQERINTSQEYGGFALTQATFLYNFGFKPDYYMMTDFNGFKGIVDTLGGIDVYAAYNLTDTCDLPQAVDKMCTVYAGLNHFDGQTALWYARSRKSTSDFDRTRRAQEVIYAILQKLMSLNAVNRGPELYDMFKASVETDIPASTIVSMLPLGLKIYNDSSILKRYSIGAAEVTNYVVPESGAQVLLPNQEAVMAIIRQALSQ